MNAPAVRPTLCPRCNAFLRDCASCGEMQCRCRPLWSSTVWQHYRADGTPYTLAPHLRLIAPEESSGLGGVLPRGV